MAKRKPRQGIDYVVYLLKKLAKDEKASGRIRLEAIDRLATIDRIYSTEVKPPTGEPGEPSPPVVDTLLKQLEAQARGGDRD